MKQPRRITLVPAHTMVQLGSTGTGRSWAAQLSAEKSTHMLLIASHEPQFKFLDTEQGAPYKAAISRAGTRQKATVAYNNRVKKQFKS